MDKKKLRSVICCICGVEHAFPTDMYNERLKEGGSWYCPNGHNLVFLQKSKDEEIKEIKDELDQVKEKLKEKEEIIKQNKIPRTKSGFCHICKKGFKRLDLHLKRKHKDKNNE